MSDIQRSFSFPDILILNSNSEVSALLASLCREKGQVYLTSNIEQAIALLAKINFHVVLLQSYQGDYPRMKGLFPPQTAILIHGDSKTECLKVASTWPQNRYVDSIDFFSIQKDKTEYFRKFQRALQYSKLTEEVRNLRYDRDKNRAEIDDTLYQINQIKKTVQNSIIKETEKRISLEREFKWYRREKQKIESILKKIYLANDVTTLLDIVYEIRDLVHAGGISFSLIEENEPIGRYLKPLVWNNTIPSHSDHAKLSVPLQALDFAAETVSKHAPITSNAPASDHRLSARYIRHLHSPLHNLLSVPIRHDKDIIGVLEVYNKTQNDKPVQSGFSEADNQLIRQLSEHISIAITKLNLIQFDALTGLLRPDPFFDQISQKLKSENKRHREESSFSLVMGDVDWFKHYNDRNGHEAGNKLLRDLADILKASIREEDYLCRYGGEEFLFFMTGIKNREEALIFTDRIRKNVEDHYFESQEFQPRNNITMSFGITFFTRAYFPSSKNIYKQDLLNLVKQADMAMAEAKGKREMTRFAKSESRELAEKNKICVFQESPEQNIVPIVPKKIQSNSERRKYPRFLASISLIYKNDIRYKVTKTLNLSLSGARIASEYKMDPDKDLDLTIILGKSAFECKGNIVYSSKAREDYAGYYTGIKFSDMSLGDRRLLEQYISSLSIKTPRLN